MRVSLLALALVALLLGAPLAAAQATNTTTPGAPPPQASTAFSGNVTARYWVLPEGALAPGANGTLHFLVQANGTPMGAINYTLNASALAFANRTGTHAPAPNATNASFSIPFSIPSNASGNASYGFTLTVHGAGENATAILATLSGAGDVQVQAPAPVAAPRIPTSWLIGGGILLLVAVAAGAYSVRERRLRARMRGQARSQVMREMELEQKLEKARAKDPGQAAAIQQEIRQQETVREKRRELQILEAKRADVLKNMDLLRKRHETGGLSKLQFDNMMAKRQADLSKIEAEIAEMERQDASAA
jgi:hypothetical protein